jgi:hypothetical protein
MEAKNGVALTMIYVLAFIIGCIIIGSLALAVFTKPMTTVYMDSPYHPVVTCFHEHRI